MKRFDTQLERLLSKCTRPSDNECWNWTSPINKSGYGLFAIRIGGKKKSMPASRASYILHKNLSSYPERLQYVCHTCHNRKCVNPQHLYLGTPKTNTADMKNAGRDGQSCKTHCPNGHEYSEKNTYWYRKAGGTQHRICRKCRNSYASRNRSTKRAERRKKRLESGSTTYARFLYDESRAKVKV